MTSVLDESYLTGMVDDISEFVRIPSRSSAEGGEEGLLQELIASRMADLGASVRTFEAADLPAFFSHPLCHGPERDYAGRPTVIGEFGPEDAPGLLVLAHSDTVQIASAKEWSFDPFLGEIRDGAVWGLGAADDKWGLAAMLVMLRAIRDSGSPLRKLIFASTIDEEHGVGNGTLLLKLAGIRAESALYLDGYGLTVFIGNLGGSSLSLATKSSIEKGLRLRHEKSIAETCERLSAERAGLFDRPYYRENWARERSFIFALSADRFVIGFYTLPGESRQEMCEVLETRLVEALGDDLELYDTSYREPWFEPAIVPEDTPLVTCLSDGIRSVLEREPVLATISKQDAYVLTNHAGIPTVSFGGLMQDTGRGSFHNPDERIPIEEAWTATRIAYSAVRRWMED